jgi:hypothetical protein
MQRVKIHHYLEDFPPFVGQIPFVKFGSSLFSVDASPAEAQGRRDFVVHSEFLRISTCVPMSFSLIPPVLCVSARVCFPDIHPLEIARSLKLWANTYGALKMWRLSPAIGCPTKAYRQKFASGKPGKHAPRDCDRHWHEHAVER